MKKNLPYVPEQGTAFQKKELPFRKLIDMRTNFTLPAICLMALFVTQSCSKDSQQQEMVLNLPSVEEINATVSPNTGYEFKLEDYGNVKISKQASHFLESVTGVDVKTGKLRYKYVPATDFTGTDEVELKSTKTTTNILSGGPNDCNNGSGSSAYTSSSTKLLRIKFTIQ